MKDQNPVGLSPIKSFQNKVFCSRYDIKATFCRIFYQRNFHFSTVQPIKINSFPPKKALVRLFNWEDVLVEMECDVPSKNTSALLCSRHDLSSLSLRFAPLYTAECIHVYTILQVFHTNTNMFCSAQVLSKACFLRVLGLGSWLVLLWTGASFGYSCSLESVKTWGWIICMIVRAGNNFKLISIEKLCVNGNFSFGFKSSYCHVTYDLQGLDF